MSLKLKWILARLHRESKLSIPVKTSLKIVDFVKSTPNPTSLLPQILKLNATNTDLEQLAYILTKDSLNTKYAVEIYKMAAANGSLKAKYQLAKVLSRGYDNNPPNPEQALEIIVKLAAQGYTQAEYVTAMHHLKNNKTSDALKLLTSASSKGHAGANTILGTWYGKGMHVSKDLSKSKQMLQLASDKGVPEAKASLSQFYINDPSPKSRLKAVELLMSAAEAGIEIAQHNLAELYFQESDIPGRDVKIGKEYYKMAAEQGFEESIKVLKLLECEPAGRAV